MNDDMINVLSEFKRAFSRALHEKPIGPWTNRYVITHAETLEESEAIQRDSKGLWNNPKCVVWVMKDGYTERAVASVATVFTQIRKDVWGVELLSHRVTLSACLNSAYLDREDPTFERWGANFFFSYLLYGLMEVFEKFRASAYFGCAVDLDLEKCKMPKTVFRSWFGFEKEKGPEWPKEWTMVMAVACDAALRARLAGALAEREKDAFERKPGVVGGDLPWDGRKHGFNLIHRKYFEDAELRLDVPNVTTTNFEIKVWRWDVSENDAMRRFLERAGDLRSYFATSIGWTSQNHTSKFSPSPHIGPTSNIALYMIDRSAPSTENIAGLIVLSLIEPTVDETRDNSYLLKITSLATNPGYMRKGIATLLVHYALKTVLSNVNLFRVRFLGSNATSDQSKRVLEKLGFQATTTARDLEFRALYGDTLFINRWVEAGSHFLRAALNVQQGSIDAGKSPFDQVIQQISEDETRPTKRRRMECAYCSNTGEMSYCGACYQTAYCRTECQIAHWEEHAKTCGRPFVWI